VVNQNTPSVSLRLTHRDVRLVRDVALSHVLSRDQILALGYFTSVTRANTRLRGLVGIGLLKRLDTPFFSQGLYTVTKRTTEIVGERVAPLIDGRADSPRFLQHALMVTNVRLALMQRGASEWRFEPQLWARFEAGGVSGEVRPDGLALIPGKGALAVEVDLGHVAPAKFAAKLLAFDRFITSGSAQRVWGVDTIRLLTVTTGPLRAQHLVNLTPPACSFLHVVETFATFDLTTLSSWS